MKQTIVYILPIFLWMSLIFYFSSIPSLTPGFSSRGFNIVISKLSHITEYAILTFLLARALKIYNLPVSFQSLLRIVFLIALFYAISDEYHQLFVHGREGTFRDIMIDSIGITLIALYLTLKKQSRQNKTTFSNIQHKKI